MVVRDKQATADLLMENVGNNWQLRTFPPFLRLFASPPLPRLRQRSWKGCRPEYCGGARDPQMVVEANAVHLEWLSAFICSVRLLSRSVQGRRLLSKSPGLRTVLLQLFSSNLPFLVDYEPLKVTETLRL
jgi:hypothetical protein